MLSSLGYLGVMFLLFFVSRSNLISFYSALIRLIFFICQPQRSPESKLWPTWHPQPQQPPEFRLRPWARKTAFVCSSVMLAPVNMMFLHAREEEEEEAIIVKVV